MTAIVAMKMLEDEYTSIRSERNDNPRPRNPYAHGERSTPSPRTELVASVRSFADLKNGERFLWGGHWHKAGVPRDVMVKVGVNHALNKTLSDSGSWLDDENMYVRTLQSSGHTPLDEVEPIVEPLKPSKTAMPNLESKRLAASLLDGTVREGIEHLKKFQFGAKKNKDTPEDKEKPAKSGTGKFGGGKEDKEKKAASGTEKMTDGPKEDKEPKAKGGGGGGGSSETATMAETKTAAAIVDQLLGEDA